VDLVLGIDLARSTFDCIVFLFVTHPFDTGDRIMIDNNFYVVEEMSILNTILVIDGKRIYYPNTVLMQKVIVNIRRSGDMTDYVEVKIDLYTPEEKLRELQQRMVGYVKEHCRTYRPVVSMNITEMRTMFMVVSFSLELKGNWQDGGKRLGNRTNFMLTLKKHMIDLDIQIATDIPRI
jgi:small-conductance mechanosensitive channel